MQTPPPLFSAFSHSYLTPGSVRLAHTALLGVKTREDVHTYKQDTPLSNLPSCIWLIHGLPAKIPLRLYIGEPTQSPGGSGRCPLKHQGNRSNSNLTGKTPDAKPAFFSSKNWDNALSLAPLVEAEKRTFYQKEYFCRIKIPKSTITHPPTHCLVQKSWLQSLYCSTQVKKIFFPLVPECCPQEMRSRGKLLKVGITLMDSRHTVQCSTVLYSTVVTRTVQYTKIAEAALISGPHAQQVPMARPPGMLTRADLTAGPTASRSPGTHQPPARAPGLLLEMSSVFQDLRCDQLAPRQPPTTEDYGGSSSYSEAGRGALWKEVPPSFWNKFEHCPSIISSGVSCACAPTLCPVP